jgi:hypothetical protein
MPKFARFFSCVPNKKKHNMYLYLLGIKKQTTRANTKKSAKTTRKSLSPACLY